MHRLCVIAAAGDPSGDAIYADLEDWLSKDGANLNVALDRVNADDPGVKWADYGVPSAPPNLPVVVLAGVSPSPRRAFVVDHWEPGPTPQDLAAILTSPVREEIKANVTSHWAVVLFSPGRGSSGHARSVVDAVAGKWRQEHAPGVHVVHLDRSDLRERLVCSFAGVNPAGLDWLGVVFGRGKLLAPPLLGDEITEANLDQLLSSVTAPCTCLQGSITLGLDIPMTWEAALDGRVVSLGAADGLGGTVPGGPVGSLDEEVSDSRRYMVVVAVVALGCPALAAVGFVSVAIWRSSRRGKTVLEG